MDTIRERYTTSAILFGGASNRYHSADEARQIVTRVRVNAFGQYVAEWGTGRTIDYAGNPCRLISRIEGTSPLFTVVDDAFDWADAAGGWAVENYISSCGNQLSPFPLATERHSVCPKCDRFDTLRVEMQAYGNLTTCEGDGCDFEQYASIGD